MIQQEDYVIWQQERQNNIDSKVKSQFFFILAYIFHVFIQSTM